MKKTVADTLGVAHSHVAERLTRPARPRGSDRKLEDAVLQAGPATAATATPRAIQASPSASSRSSMAAARGADGQACAARARQVRELRRPLRAPLVDEEGRARSGPVPPAPNCLQAPARRLALRDEGVRLAAGARVDRPARDRDGPPPRPPRLGIDACEPLAPGARRLARLEEPALCEGRPPPRVRGGGRERPKERRADQSTAKQDPSSLKLMRLALVTTKPASITKAPASKGSKLTSTALG